MRPTSLPVLASAVLFVLGAARTASAQGYPPQPGYPPQGGYPPPGAYAPPGGYAPPPQGYAPNTQGGYNPSAYGAAPPSTQSSDLEISALYVAAAGYGAGTGIWIDAEAGIKDPGLRFIAPIVLGVGAPVGVYFLDQPPLPRGVPAAISAGLMLGAGEGIGISSYQFVSANKSDAWGFKGLARGTFIGATIGGGAGAAVGFLQEPSPKISLFAGSGAVWGAGIGTMFGYGGSKGHTGYGLSNDAAAGGGLIGYNVGMIGAAALATAYVPTYRSIAFMWAGAGIGFVATLPVYLFYAGSDSVAKRGLIVQGVGTTLGLAAGGIFTLNDKDNLAEDDPYHGPNRPIGRLTAVAPMMLPGGGGAQIMGVLF